MSRARLIHKLYRLYRYAWFLLDRFKFLILAAVATFLVCTWLLWTFHPDQADPQTRVGFGSVAFNVFELMFSAQPTLPYPRGSAISQVIYFVLPILNILGFAAAVAQFSQILFDRGLYNRAQADNADGHVILCGVGRLGREVLKQLDQRHKMKRRRDVVIVDNGGGLEALDSEFIRREPIIPVICGSMTDASTLRAAGIDRAIAVMMLTGDDTTNLEAALLAREMNPNVTVVLRTSNKRMSERLDAMLRGSMIRNFHLIDSVEGSAPKCLGLCGLLDGADGKGPACSLDIGVELNNASGHVVVCGLGRLGYGVVRLLKGRVPVVVVDSGNELYYADDPVLTADPAVPIVRGDMTIKRVLLEARVDRAAVVMLLTPDDTRNLEAAMLVHELNPRVRSVMRIDNSRISHRLDKVLREAFGESLRVVDPSEHAAPLFVDAVSGTYESSLSPGSTTTTSGAGTLPVAGAPDVRV